MRGVWNEADVSLAFALGLEIAPDGQEPCVLPLASGIGLQGDGVKSGDLPEPALDVVGKAPVSRCAVRRNEGMDIREFGPSDRFHFRRCIELHGAGAERDHGPVQRQILPRQRLQIPHHGCLGAVLMEGPLRQKAGSAPSFRKQRVRLPRSVETKHGADDLQLPFSNRFVERECKAVRTLLARQETLLPKSSHRLVRVLRGHEYSVEQGALSGQAAGRARCCGEPGGEVMHASRDGLQAFRAVPDRVGGGHVCEQCLRGTDVRGRLLPPNMLFSGLQREPEGRATLLVHGPADNSPRSQANVLPSRRNKRRVRSAVTHRHTKSLQGANHNVGPPACRRCEKCERERIGDGDYKSSRRLRCRHHCLRRPVLTVPARPGDQHRGQIRTCQFCGGLRIVHDRQLDVHALGARPEHILGLRVETSGHRDPVALAAMRR